MLTATVSLKKKKKNDEEMKCTEVHEGKVINVNKGPDPGTCT